MRKLWQWLMVLALVVQLPIAELSLPGYSIVFPVAEAARKKKEDRSTPALREATYKKLAEAQVLADAKDLRGAINLLKATESARGMNEYELAQVYSMMAAIYYQLDQPDEAARHYEKLLQAGGDKIPVALESATLYNLAQLKFVSEKYQEALNYMNRWFDVAENPGPEPYLLVAQAYYQMEKYREALPQIQTAMDVARQRNKPIPENWWQLMNACYYQMEDWNNVLKILRNMVLEFPKRDYWIQLAGVYAQLGEEKKALNVLQVANYQKFLERESEFRNVFGLLMQEDIPASAARVLEAALKSGKVEKTDKNYMDLAQAYHAGGDVDLAIDAYTRAAGANPSGETYARLANLFWEKDDNAKCVDAASNGLRRGGAKRPVDLRITKGMCEHSLHRYDDALASFRSALNGADQSQQRTIQQWIKYVESDLNRMKALGLPT